MTEQARPATEKKRVGTLVSVHAGNSGNDADSLQIGATHTTKSGAPVESRMFPKHALGLRGVVGVVDVAGLIESGSQVLVESPK